MFLYSSHDVFNVFFETQVQHNVSLIEHSKSQLTKIEILSLHVVLYSAGGTYEDVDTASQFLSLSPNVNTTIDGKHIVLTRIKF